MSDAGGAAASSLGRDILQVAKPREDSGGKIKISPLIEFLAEFHRLTSDCRDMKEETNSSNVQTNSSVENKKIIFKVEEREIKDI